MSQNPERARNPAPPREHITLPTDLYHEYGKHSWSLRQCVVDIIQNHLDAEQRHAGPLALPKIQVRVTAEQEHRWIRYDQLPALDPIWKLSGIRVHDRGSGFHHELLSIIGGSTKTEHAAQRGGLGEGLKMSVLHLLRSGAAVRLLSKHEDGAWVVTPRISPEDQKLAFSGVKLSTPLAQNRRGSITEITLASGKGQAELAALIDPRCNATLGELILSFHPEFRGRIPTHGVLPSTIPPGRAYVADLLVAEGNPPLLFSYNLPDKFAIDGRDRKQAKFEILASLVWGELRRLGGPERERLAVAIKGGTDCLEAQLLAIYPKTFLYEQTDRSSWRADFQRALNVKGDSKVIFLHNNTPESLRGRAVAAGLQVVTLAPGPQSMIPFLIELFDIQAVSQEQFEISERGLQPQAPKQQHALPEQTLATFERIRAIIREQLPESLLVRFSATAIEVVSGEAWSTTCFDPERQKILVPANAELTHKNCAALIVEISKALANTRILDLESQAVLTMIAGWRYQKPGTVLEEIILPPTTGTALSSRAVLDWTRNSPARKQAELDYQLARGQLSNTLRKDAETFARDHLCSQCFEYLAWGQRSHLLADSVLLISPIFNTHYQWLPRPSDKTIAELTVGEQIDLPPDTTAWRKLSVGKELRLSATIEGTKTPLILRRIGEMVELSEVGSSARPSQIFNSVSLGSAASISVFPATDTEQLLLIHSAKKGIAVELEAATTERPAPERDPLHGLSRIETLIATGFQNQSVTPIETIVNELLQNHTDAGDGIAPQISFRIQHPDGRIELQTLEQRRAGAEDYWREPSRARTLEIIIEDQGPGYSVDKLAIVGLSEKKGRAKGKFGEGTKLLSLAALSSNISVTFESRDWSATPALYRKEIADFQNKQRQQFGLLAYDLRWGEMRSGSRTVIRAPEVGASIREKMDWKELAALIDPVLSHNNNVRQGAARFLAPDTPRIEGWEMELLLTKPGEIYENGYFICNFVSQGQKPSLFGYNVTGKKVCNSRERNSVDHSILREMVREQICSLTDHESIRTILRAATARELFYETDLLARESEITNTLPQLKHPALWAEAFEAEFGQEAILSVVPHLEDQVVQASALEAERNIPPSNLRHLHKGVSRLLAPLVATYKTRNQALSSLPSIALPESTANELHRRAVAINRLAGKNLPIESVRTTVEYRSGLKALAGMRVRQLLVRGPEFPVLGLYEGLNGSFQISVNSSTFEQGNTTEVYLHEVAHHLSGAQDFTHAFNRTLALLSGIPLQALPSKAGKLRWLLG